MLPWPVLIKFFDQLKPEGIAFDPEDGSLLVTFDEDKDDAQFVRVPLQALPQKKNEQ